MRRVTMATRDELVVAVQERYANGERREKTRILDEFVAVTGFHRKHAVRVLRRKPMARGGPRPGRRLYDDAVREALILIWEASDRICGKRLKPLMPLLTEAMERHGHLKLAPEIRTRLLAVSAATIDRALRSVRDHAVGRARRRTAPSLAIRRSIPVRTFSDWHDPPPGFVEADLVAHNGSSPNGSFIQTLVLTDVATGWTECAPSLVREQKLLSEVLTELRKLLPFNLLGLDTDNDSVFMNETVRDYCQAAGVVFTRCRPYRKNEALLNPKWVRLRSMGVDRGEVEPSGDEQDHGFHRLEAGVSTRLALGGLKEAVNGFDEAIGLTGLGPSGDAIEMSADHDGDVLHGVDVGARHIGAPLFQHGGYDVNLLAIENVTQLLSIEPGARSAFGGELRDEPVEVGCLLVGELTSILEQCPAQPFERGVGLLL
jgi:hypothetical protein